MRLQASIEEFYLSPVQWAARMDDTRFRIEILQRMIFQLKGSDASAFFFPPLLGLELHEAFLGMLSTELDAPVHELMGVPGWPPGLRAGLMVESALAEAGVEILRERARTVERKAGGDIEGMMNHGTYFSTGYGIEAFAILSVPYRRESVKMVSNGGTDNSFYHKVSLMIRRVHKMSNLSLH